MIGDVIKFRVIVFIVPLAILVLALAGGHVLVWRLFSLSALLLLLSYVWARLGIHGIEGQINQPAKHCQVGDSFDVEAVISNVSLLPKLLIKVRENTNLPGHSNQLAINLRPRESYSWQTNVHCQLRGQYRLGSLTVEVADPFGLFPAHRELGESQSLLVYPATCELPHFWITSYVEPGSGQNFWLTTEPNPVVSRVREYVPGDSLSRIHWRSTAHVGKLIVKDFDLDLSKSIWVIMDMSKPSPAGNGTNTIEEHCVMIAASLVKKYVDSGQQVGLITQGDDFYLFPPQVGHQHLWRVMGALALVKAVGEIPVNRLINREIERFGSNSIAVVITSSTSDEMVASLLHLKSRGATMVAILLDATSFGGIVNPQGIARHLTSNGIPAYTVRQGDDLATALDSRGIVPVDERLRKVA
jgi:uncharacterized protein (DUF58 family)